MAETLDIGMPDDDSDMLALMSETRRDRARFMDRLYGWHVVTGLDEMLQEKIGRLAEEAAASHGGNRTEGRALFIIGETGAGKTRIVNKALDSLPELQPTQTEMATISPVARVVAPSPMTLLQLGHEILHAIGYPVQRTMKESAIWREVRNQLKLRGVQVLHIDEGQHMLAWNNPPEIEKLANTLKNVMQRRDWPVWFVVSGLPELADFVERDRQIQRRSEVVALPSLDPSKARRMLEWLLFEIVEKHAGMRLGVKVGESGDQTVPYEFLNRLCHAAWSQFGILTEIVRGAVEQALIRDAGADEVKDVDFSEAYRAFSGCTSDENIMRARRWDDIDPREAISQLRTTRYSKS